MHMSVIINYCYKGYMYACTYHTGACMVAIASHGIEASSSCVYTLSEYYQIVQASGVRLQDMNMK